MFKEHAVVANAESHDDVELATMGIEHPCLGQGIAQRFELAGAYFFLVGKSEFFFWNAAVLARDRDHFKAVTLEYGAKHVCVVDETDAVRDTDLPVAHLLREMHDFLHARPLAIAFRFDQRGDA